MMSTYMMPAEQSLLAVSDFATEDASFFNSSPLFPVDFLGPVDEAVWNMSPMSPSLSAWNLKNVTPFATSNLERETNNNNTTTTTTQVRNGHPTPRLDDKDPSVLGSPMTALNKNPQNDMPTPPSGEDGAGNGSISYPAGFSPPFQIDAGFADTNLLSLPPAAGPTRLIKSRERVKRAKSLERNRLAASKCRKKKKEHTTLLESRFKEQSDKRERLRAETSRLHSRILGLKNEFLRHAQCGDKPINLHLAQMVKQITSKDRSHSADGSQSLPDTVPSPSVHGSVAFGFDEPLQLDGATTLEQQIRRDSEAFIALRLDADFKDLIDV
jgi:hypothetical protein